MISVPWPPMLAPPLLALAEPLPARSPALPDPLDPDAPERDCSLPVDLTTPLSITGNDSVVARPNDQAYCPSTVVLPADAMAC
jgi:hypothetical protein